MQDKCLERLFESVKQQFKMKPIKGGQCSDTVGVIVNPEYHKRHSELSHSQVKAILEAPPVVKSRASADNVHQM